jgi:hypothetical protein
VKLGLKYRYLGWGVGVVPIWTCTLLARAAAQGILRYHSIPGRPTPTPQASGALSIDLSNHDGPLNRDA